MGFWDDAEVLSSYSRNRAIKDGLLVSLGFPVCREHYKYPICCTSSVWSIIDRAVKNVRWCNDLEGVLHDILWMSRKFNSKVNETTVLFQVIIKGAGRKTNYVFKLVCGPSDDRTPCLTIMLPEED
jgi:hypothetical protein